MLSQKNKFSLFGNKVRCFGTDKADSWKRIRGFTSFGWLGNEVTLSHKRCIDEAIKRNSGNGFRIFWDTNTDHPKHPIKTEYIDKSGDKLDNDMMRIKSFHFQIEDNSAKNNGFLSEIYIENLKKSTPRGYLYDRDILGLWVAAEGMIYQSFNPDIHIVDEIVLSRLEKRFVGVDWGFDHYGSMMVIGEDHDGNHYVIEEIAERQRTIDWWQEQKEYITAKYGLMPFYCGPDRPDHIEMIGGYPANNAVIEGITYVSQLFHNSKLYIHRTCKKTLSEIYEYRWNEKVAKEQPVKENDDCMDALRYGCYTHYTGKIVASNLIGVYNTEQPMKL